MMKPLFQKAYKGAAGDVMVRQLTVFCDLLGVIILVHLKGIQLGLFPF